MSNLLIGSVLAAAYIVIFWLLGAILPDRFHSQSIPVMCITGFLLYFSLFQVIALPMKIFKQPLSYLTMAWFGLLILLVFYVILKRRRPLIDSLKNLFPSIPKLLLVFWVMILALAVALLLGFNTNTISDYDACYYIGLPVSSVYSNTLELLSPYTGLLLEEPQHFYLLNTDTLNSAVIYQALNIHPLLERKYSFTIAMVLIFEMGLYLCGKHFFQKENSEKDLRISGFQKTAVFCLLSNLVLLYAYSIAGVSHYFAYRTYEGKAITSYLYMTLIFCFCLALYQKEDTAKTPQDDLWPWAGLFLCGVSGVAFCNTALFVVPAMMGITLLPYIISKGLLHKHWKVLLRFILVLLPCLIWIALYKLL